MTTNLHRRICPVSYPTGKILLTLIANFSSRPSALASSVWIHLDELRIYANIFMRIRLHVSNNRKCDNSYSVILDSRLLSIRIKPLHIWRAPLGEASIWHNVVFHLLFAWLKFALLGSEDVNVLAQRKWDTFDEVIIEMRCSAKTVRNYLPVARAFQLCFPVASCLDQG